MTKRLDVNRVADGLLDAVEKPIASFSKRLQALEARIVQLESKSLHFVGTWSENERRALADKIGSFGVGSLLVDKGGLWHARRVTSARPGTGDDWQLITKRGDFYR